MSALNQLVGSFYTAAAGGGSITILDEPAVVTGTSPAVVFGATPSDGEMLVFIASSLIAITGPAAFTTATVSATSTTRRMEVYTHVAASEASATYTFTGNGSGTIVVYGYRLSQGTVVTPTGSNVNSASAVSSIALASAGINVPTNSFVVGGIMSTSGTIGTAAAGPTNSFVSEYYNSSNRTHFASRMYTTGGASENTTLAWTTARDVISAILAIEP